MSPDQKLLLRALLITVVFAIIGGGMLFMIMESDYIFSVAAANITVDPVPTNTSADISNGQS